MRRSSSDSWRVLLAIAAILVALPLAAAAPTVTFTASGTAVPGAAVSVRATPVITDGSTVSGYKWTQVGGVTASLANTTSDTVVATLGSVSAYKHDLVQILEEPSVPASKLPPYVPADGEFMGGLQNRFVVAAIPPLAHEEAAAVTLQLELTTSSGTFKFTTAIATDIPWPISAGLTNVAIGSPVLLQSKEQATYNWVLAAPATSAAKLTDATTRNPYFTPDIPGLYTLTVTNLETAKPVSMKVYAGKWKGMVTGLDANNRPVADAQCRTCHVGLLEKFGPWSKSGHAEIFMDQVNTPAGHYSTACLSCHTVGMDTKGVDNGINEQSDWNAFLATDLLTHGAAGNFAKILTQFPNTARFTNIQCENCHGPQDSEGHATWTTARTSLSSDVCGSCHGEPPRHGRYQQWQLSAHANYDLAHEEGTSPSCAKCHSAQGFVQWDANNFSTANLNVTWTTDDVHPQTCATCHDPHDVGTTSGGPDTNSKVRVQGDTPALDAGFTAKNVGTAALCMTCHNGRRGLRDDQHFTLADATRAPHVGPQADTVMGYNLYFTTVGVTGNHAKVKDSCVTCHMESTPPVGDLSYQLGGTNHTFFASKTICAKCHSQITVESVQGPVEQKLATIKAEMEKAIKNLMQQQIRMGNAIDLGGLKTVKNASDITAVEFIESHGRQGVNVTLTSGPVNDLSLQSVKVVRPAGGPVELYAVADPNLGKVGWNYFEVHSDASHGVHNPTFVNSALDGAIHTVKGINQMLTVTSMPAGGNAALGGGLGNGAGAMSCNTQYVYWVEIAGHNPGQAGSQWRTDIVARNLATSDASLKFYLHQSNGLLQGNGAVLANGQNAFTDIVSRLGGENNIGSLEICSDRPLLVNGRIFNAAANGTFGQNLDGHVGDLGYAAGQTVSLIGLRQKSNAFRSNISVTNGGATEAQVSITLFDATGKSLTTYTLTVPAGGVLQDVEPFRTRANAPDTDWGFATVTVLKGTNLRMSGSMIDMLTNDPTTIMPKQ